jgi:hypothetical protein
MLKSILTAVLVVGAATAASAATKNYTFADSSGNAYCDGISLEQSGISAVGTHDGCADDQAGGFEGNFSGEKLFAITTTQVGDFPNYVEAYFIDEKAMAWSLYLEDTIDGIPYTYNNSGLLLKGKPAARYPGARSTMSSLRK